MNVASVTGTLSFKDDLSAAWDRAISTIESSSTKLQSSLDNLASKIDSVKPKTEKVKDETDKLAQSYTRLSAQLDPAAALSQKYNAAVSTLDSALRRGLISQAEYNTRLQQARDKYSSVTIEARRQQAETDKLRASYRNLAAQLDPTIARQQKYDNAIRILQQSLARGIITQKEFTRQVQLAGIQFTETASRASRLSSAISGELLSRAAGFIGVGVAIDRTIALLKSFVKANIEAEESQRRVEAATSRAGNATGVTAKQIFDLADSYSKLTGIDDEVIADAAALATRFNRLREDIFPDVVRLALDMSAATGDDLSSAMQKTAGYVNLPVQALTKMKREGIAVEKGQSDLVKKLAASNDILGAQRVILQILEAQYGGTALEMRDTMGGAVNALATSWENLLEKIGEDDFGPARESLEKLIKLIDEMTAKVDTAKVGWIQLSITINEVLASITRIQIGAAEGPLARFLNPAGAKASADQMRKNLADLEKEIAAGYGDLGKQLSKMGVIPESLAKQFGFLTDEHKKGAVAARGQTEQEDKLGDSLGKVRDQLKKTIDALERRTEKTKSFLDAFRSGGPEGLQREQDRQAALDELLNIQNSLREKGLSLTREQAGLIAQLVLDERGYNRELAVAQRAYEKIGSLAYLPLNALERQEAQLKRNMPLYLAMEEASRKNNEELQQTIDLLETGINNIAAAFEYASESTQRALEAARAMAAYDAGQIGADERDARLRQSSNPLFSAAEQELFDFAQGVRDSFKTTRVRALEYQAQIERAVNAGMLSAEEGQTAILESTQVFWSDQLSAWGNAFSLLANRFGGFFNYLNDLVQGLQEAQQFGQSVGQIAGGLTGNASLAGAAGGVATVAYIWYMVYDTVDKIIKDSKTRNYGTYGDFGITDFQESISTINEQSEEIVKSIRSTIESFEDALRISVEDLADIGIKLRNDGKRVKAYVQGVLLGVFGSAEEAIQAALAAALKDPNTTLRGLSDLMREGLASTSANDLDELTDVLQTLREISDLNLSQGAIQIQETIRRLDEMFRLLERMPGSMATLQGFTNVVRTEVDSWLAWRRSITGEQESPAEAQARQQREAAMFNAEKKMRIADLQLRQIELKIQQNMLRARGNMLQADTQLGSAQVRAQGGVLAAKSQLVSAELDLYKAQLSAIDAALLAISDLITQLENIPEIDPNNIKLPRTGAGRGGQLDSVRSFIDDRTFQLAVAAMSEYRRQVAEITRQYDQQIEQTRRDSKERAQLIALRDQELEQLERERGRTVADSFSSFVKGQNQFDQIRQTAEDLIKEIEDSPFGNARKAAMIGRVMSAVDAQIERLANESARGIFGSLISDLEKYGADAELLQQARLQMEILEHTIKMANYAVEIEALRAQGKIPAQIVATMDRAFDFLKNVDVTEWFGTTGGTGGTSTSQPLTPTGQALRDALAERQAREAEELADALKRARESLKKYQQDGVDPFTRALMEVRDDFADIRRAMGNTPEVVSTFNDAIARVVDEYLEPITESQRDLFYGDLSVADTTAQWAEIQRERDQIMAQFAAGDLSVLEKIPEFGEQYLALAELMSPKSSQGFKGLASQWNDFLNQVKLQAPQIAATSAVLGSSASPMTVAGMADVARYSEIQVDRLERVNYTQQQMLGVLQILNGKVQSPQGGLTNVH